jgi:DNA-binding CsgD family transcriptional regulator
VRPDIIGIVEAAYDLDSENSKWLAEIVVRMKAGLPGALGAIAITYEIGDLGRVRVMDQSARQMPDEFFPISKHLMESHSADYVRETFACTPCAMSSHVGSPETRAYTRSQMAATFGHYGWRDLFVVNGLDPTHRGLWLGFPMGHSRGLSPTSIRLWSRVATHLAAANRLRHRLSAQQDVERPDAVLTPSGRMEHADDAAKSKSARAELGRGARVLDRARGKLRKSDPDRAVAEWKGLIAARWTLIDHFESDGRRYLLARRNEAAREGYIALSDRERQAIGFARLGHANKLIAYEMGISPSTVAVLIHRAMKKLGLRSRADLLGES